MDINEIKSAPLNIDMDTFRKSIPTNYVYDQFKQQNDENMREVMRSIEEGRTESKEEFKEMLVEALQKAGVNSGSITISGSEGDIQIQINSDNSSQIIDKSQPLDYSQVIKIMSEIREYFNYSQFEETYGDQTENMKNLVESTIQACKSGEDEGLIKKTLSTIKTITLGVGSSLLAQGILSLLTMLPF